jgi:hypothetical protein
MAPLRRTLSAARLALALLGAGCGPVVYMSRVTMSAASAVEQAEAAGAAEKSPYWYTRATFFLRRARIEAADADFEAANRFGRIAEEAARRAYEEANAGGAPRPPGDLPGAAGGPDAPDPDALDELDRRETGAAP